MLLNIVNSFDEILAYIRERKMKKQKKVFILNIVNPKSKQYKLYFYKICKQNQLNSENKNVSFKKKRKETDFFQLLLTYKLSKFMINNTHCQII